MNVTMDLLHIVEQAHSLERILDAATRYRVDGIIATNTTLDRAAIPPTSVPGGLSGAPLRERSTRVIRYIARQSLGALPIIGVGGIMDAADAALSCAIDRGGNAVFSAGQCPPLAQRRTSKEQEK